MTEQEFQLKYGFSDEDLAEIKVLCKLFKGKVTKIEENL